MTGREGPERRARDEVTAHKRRREDRAEDFNYRRDQALLILGIGGVIAMTVLNAMGATGDTGIALALIAMFGGFAASPTVLRLDERRRERLGRDE